MKNEPVLSTAEGLPARFWSGAAAGVRSSDYVSAGLPQHVSKPNLPFCDSDKLVS
jgi:hypothetical protein